MIYDQIKMGEREREKTRYELKDELRDEGKKRKLQLNSIKFKLGYVVISLVCFHLLYSYST